MSHGEIFGLVMTFAAAMFFSAIFVGRWRSKRERAKHPEWDSIEKIKNQVLRIEEGRFDLQDEIRTLNRELDKALRDLYFARNAPVLGNLRTHLDHKNQQIQDILDELETVKRLDEKYASEIRELVKGVNKEDEEAFLNWRAKDRIE